MKKKSSTRSQYKTKKLQEWRESRGEILLKRLEFLERCLEENEAIVFMVSPPLPKNLSSDQLDIFRHTDEGAVEKAKKKAQENIEIISKLIEEVLMETSRVSPVTYTEFKELVAHKSYAKRP